jgi:hypothetical protein
LVYEKQESNLIAVPGPITSASLKKAPLCVMVPAEKVTWIILIVPEVDVRNAMSQREFVFTMLFIGLVELQFW